MTRPKPGKIPVSEILHINNPADYKVHFATYNKIRQPLDSFVNDWEQWEAWNSWKPENDEFNRRHIFSLMDFYPQKGLWLFGGIWNVLKTHPHAGTNGYEIELSGQYKSYIGRLLLEYDLRERNRRLKFEKHYAGLIVSRILESSYDGRDQPSPNGRQPPGSGPVPRIS